MITLTDSARDHLIEICSTHDMDAVRLSVRGGGCAGFSYEWDVIKKDELKDEEIIELRDTDYVFAVDVIAIMYLIGSTIDYKTDIMGSMLTVVNPNSTSSCGCGESVAFG